MSQSNQPGQHSGFTLPELLVAIALMAILAILSYRGIDGLQRTVAHTEQTSERWQTVGRAMDRLVHDLSQPARRVIDESSGMRSPIVGGTTGSGDQIAFYRRPRLNGQPEQRMAYRLSDGRLELLLWPPAPASKANAEPEVHALLSDVADFRVRYLGFDLQWHERWPTSTASPMPKAIKLMLRLVDGKEVERILALP